MAKRQIVLQFKIGEHGSVDDFERLAEIEEKLDGALRRNRSGYVDGHDMGSGTMNIFVVCPSWVVGEEFLALYVKYQDWATDVVIVRDKRERGFEVFYPAGYDGEFRLM
jgi:hypothetical protein